ncbi:hypothetical protein TBLA_0I01200 [Henningerozyma blattae CBS 6284]|uniref:Uncharacterized protein n=1 Tax=Henningerozyma blattae (strain ATCC 34711 / CBS 6284 / DSM 70876 / NBRC 10599 / NRRL Y-10934 / UCD 77-7) TaxID=1071380 RepID=I2H8S8_HENB6|nr:hypothetical protein TBLA_0I01200 [Tetrapisispora blattae CBS 6284]CCH62780.1 hypothetical protein TBLA_0I01200 [Tetrapisispora blattae CBS 6284]
MSIRGPHRNYFKEKFQIFLTTKHPFHTLKYEKDAINKKATCDIKYIWIKDKIDTRKQKKSKPFNVTYSTNKIKLIITDNGFDNKEEEPCRKSKKAKRQNLYGIGIENPKILGNSNGNNSKITREGKNNLHQPSQKPIKRYEEAKKDIEEVLDIEEIEKNIYGKFVENHSIPYSIKKLTELPNSFWNLDNINTKKKNGKDLHNSDSPQTAISKFIGELNYLPPEPINDIDILNDVLNSKPKEMFLRELYQDLKCKQLTYSKIMKPKDFTIITSLRNERWYVRILGEYCPVRIRRYKMRNYNDANYLIYREQLYIKAFKKQQKVCIRKIASWKKELNKIVKNKKIKFDKKVDSEFQKHIFGEIHYDEAGFNLWNKQRQQNRKKESTLKKNDIKRGLTIRERFLQTIKTSRVQNVFSYKKSALKKRLRFTTDLFFIEFVNESLNTMSPKKKYYSNIKLAERKHITRKWLNHQQEYQMVKDLVNDAWEERIDNLIFK